jgi:hypothetical protein
MLIPLALQFLAELAERRNAIPLPPVKETYGIRLPADRYTLTGINFQFVPQVGRDFWTRFGTCLTCSPTI